MPVEPSSSKPPRTIPSQSLFRDLEIIDAAAQGITTLQAIGEKSRHHVKYEAQAGICTGTDLVSQA